MAVCNLALAVYKLVSFVHTAGIGIINGNGNISRLYISRRNLGLADGIAAVGEVSKYSFTVGIRGLGLGDVVSGNGKFGAFKQLTVVALFHQFYLIQLKFVGYLLGVRPLYFAAFITFAYYKGIHRRIQLISGRCSYLLNIIGSSFKSVKDHHAVIV